MHFYCRLISWHVRHFLQRCTILAHADADAAAGDISKGINARALGSARSPLYMCVCVYMHFSNSLNNKQLHVVRPRGQFACARSTAPQVLRA